MGQKEQLRKRIEKERRKLNLLLRRGKGSQDAYTQSLVVDRLIEKYMEIA